MKRRTFLGLIGTAIALSAAPAELVFSKAGKQDVEITLWGAHFTEVVSYRPDFGAWQYYVAGTTKDGKDWVYAILVDREEDIETCRAAAERAIRRMMFRNGYTWGDWRKVA